jgi:hypothetical protein
MSVSVSLSHQGLNTALLRGALLSLKRNCSDSFTRVLSCHLACQRETRIARHKVETKPLHVGAYVQILDAGGSMQKVRLYAATLWRGSAVRLKQELSTKR